jgi:hypothetical protein
MLKENTKKKYQSVFFSESHSFEEGLRPGRIQFDLAAVFVKQAWIVLH